MATNNVYRRKTKREEYEEKLKQRNDNEQWMFGNTFGRPGGGAPLRDRNGNVISNLKTISNGNIFKYDAQEFTKGENNIYSINHQIYEKNKESNVNNMINDPFTPFRNYINQFDQNNNNININNNQAFMIQENNNNLNQNPYLVQLPDGNFGILSPYPMIQPMPYNNLNSVKYPVNNINNNINYINNNENIKEEIPQKRPYSSNDLNNINNTNNTNISNVDVNNNINDNVNNNSSNLNNTGYNLYSSNAPRKFLKKIPESTLFNEAAQERIKLEKERKNDQWKKDLLEQIKEKRRRDEKERKELEEKEKKDEIENDKFMKFKKKQREDHAKKLKEEQEKRMREKMQNNQSQSVANILDLSNNIDQANKSMMSNNNITFREGNLNELSQNNINLNNNENEENNNINNMQILNNNNIENNNYNPIQENFKNEINRQYHLLNETLNHDINMEMQRISKDLENNYTPFTQKLLLMNTYSKSRSDLSLEQNRKIKKIENMIEEKKLVDYVLGNRARPPSPKDDDALKAEMPVPSYFGINRDKAENKYLGLHSKSSFINKGENISNFIASGRNQEVSTINTPSSGKNLEEKNRINDMYNFAMKNDLDLHYVNDYYNNNKNKVNLNTGKGTFGTNLQNDENLGGLVNTAQNLDNISVFIPLNKDRENINSFNEKRIRPLSINENRIRDKDMENMFKDLDTIYELTNKIDVTSKARNISDKFDEELINIKNRENNMNKYFEKKDEDNYGYNYNDKNSDLNNKKSVNKNLVNKDKITEEGSKYSKTSTHKTKSNKSNSNNINAPNNYSVDNEENQTNKNDDNKVSEKNSYKSNKINESKENENEKENYSLNKKNSKESYLPEELKSESEKEGEKEEEKKENDLEKNSKDLSHKSYSRDSKDYNVENNNENNKEENNANNEADFVKLPSNTIENKKEPEIVNTNDKNKTEGNEGEEEEEDDEEDNEQ